MTPLFKLVVSVMFIVAGVLLLLSALTGCASGVAQMSDNWCDSHPGAPPYRCWDHSQSWDQENLKSHDNTCRTIVFYVDPDTKLLEQCP